MVSFKVILFFTLAALQVVSCKEYVRVCYYTNWSSLIRTSEGFFDLEKHYEDKLCTHLIYSFAKVAPDGIGGYTIQTDPGEATKPEDEKWDVDVGFKQFLALKMRDPNLKTLLAIGGWNHASEGFKQMAATRESRAYFIKQSKEFLEEHGFDGLDLDWEYPAQRGSPPEDKENFALLCEELREHYGDMLITAAVAAATSSVDISYNVPRISKSLDFINLMTYDLHGKWEGNTGHHTDMNPSRSSWHHSIHNTVSHWMMRGAPADKLVLGLASYGRTWQLKKPCSDWGIGAVGTWSGGKPGKFTGESGFLAYYEICNIKWVKHMCMSGSDAMAPYGTDGQDWIGYDDVESIVYKVKNVVKGKNLRGLMFWALDLDDFRGTCGGVKYPLIRAAKDTAMGKSVNGPVCVNVERNCVDPTQPPITYGKNGCKLNLDSPWGKRFNANNDAWCKDLGNCPSSSLVCQGTKDSMCICGGTPGTTMKPSTTTMRSTTRTTKPTTTKKLKTTKPMITTTIKTKTTKTTMKPTGGDCKPRHPGNAKNEAWIMWCSMRCSDCYKGKGVENFCFCNN